MPTVGVSAPTSPPDGNRLAGRIAAARVVGATVVGHVAAQRGTALAEAAVDGGVAAAGEAHDLLVAVPESLEVERFALARLERLHGLQAVVVLKVVERPLGGATVVGVRGLGPFAGPV